MSTDIFGQKKSRFGGYGDRWRNSEPISYQDLEMANFLQPAPFSMNDITFPKNKRPQTLTVVPEILFIEACQPPELDSEISDVASVCAYWHDLSQITASCSESVRNVSWRDIWKAVSAPSNSRKQLFTGRIDSFLKLQPGWDGYSAPVPGKVSIENAKQFVELLFVRGILPASVHASVVGGVGVTLTSGFKEAFVEFYDDDTICALYSDGDDNEPSTKLVDADSFGFVQILLDVRNHLNA